MPATPYVLVLCSANVCRSPMAQRLLEHALAREDEPLRSLRVVSAGVGAVDGEKASRNSVEALRKVGLGLGQHSSRRLTAELFSGALAVFVMTESHLRALQFAFPAESAPRHVHLFRHFLPDSEDQEIPDPYGGNLAAYEASRDSMVEAIPSLIAFLRTLLPPASAASTAAPPAPQPD